MISACSFPGCTGRLSCRGLCAAHVWQQKRGRPLTALRNTAAQKAVLFWAKVRKPADPNGCWEWIGYRDRDGYGIYARKKAHRFSWELTNGPIPAEMLAWHRCDNPPCVNPAHLFLGSPQDNSDDMVSKGRKAITHESRGAACGMAVLTDDNVFTIRRMHATGVTMGQLAVLFGVHEATIGKIISRKRWGHLPESPLEQAVL